MTIERLSIRLADHDGPVGGMKSLIDCLPPHSKWNPRGLGPFMALLAAVVAVVAVIMAAPALHAHPAG